MGETVKAQAIRRGKELDVLATVYDAILASREAMEQTTRVIERYGEWFDGLHAENAELRDANLALSNRIEALTRTVTAHHGQLAKLLGHSPLDGVPA